MYLEIDYSRLFLPYVGYPVIIIILILLMLQPDFRVYELGLLPRISRGSILKVAGIA
jgi:hypothetical protein